MKKVKKGFTLIELMIVLAIIAILAVVLIPKAGTLKNSARSTGVASNTNSVRSYLESKVGSGVVTPTALKTNLGTAFANDNTIYNPYNKSISTIATATAANTAITGGAAIAVIDSTTGTVPSPSPTISTTAGTNSGVVFINVYSDGYVVYGVDDSGTVINEASVK